jgi:hypothetical protein
MAAMLLRMEYNHDGNLKILAVLPGVGLPGARHLA